MSVELADSLVTPGVILAHVVLGGSLVSLYKGTAAGLGSVTLMAGLGEAAIVLLWRYGPTSVSTLAAVAGVAGACYLYDRLVRIPGAVRRNVVFTSDTDLEEISEDVKNAGCDVRHDNSGRHVVTTPFAYVRYAPSDWFWGSAATKAVDVDEVEAVQEGCQARVVAAVKSVGAETVQCFELVLHEGATSVTVITSSVTERDDWLTALRRLLERRIGEQRRAWVSALFLETATGQGDERSVTLTQAVNILTSVGRRVNPHYGAVISHSILKSAGTKNGNTESVMNEDQFLQFFDLAAGRPQIKQIYERLVARLPGQRSLNGAAFYDFLRTEQKEDQLSVDDARNWIHQMEPVLLRSHCLSDIGFTNYMLDEKQNIFRRDLRHVYQDMTRPLSHYFIATSHNTYLTKDQLRSKSSVDAYINVFKRGGKCVELDCWDGSGSEPVIYHGHTLTSKILFKDVIEAVRDHGFVVSQYPVILSLENHCSVEQQKVMAERLKTILGNRLYTRPISESETELPSPEALKGFVIVKNKKLKDGREDPDDDESSDDESTDENDEPDVNSNNASEVIDEVSNRTSTISKMSKKRKDKDTEKQPKLASELSDLVVYCQAVHFKDFQHSKEQGRHYEMSSFSEKKVTRFIKEDATSLVEYNRRQLSRIYPAGSRIDSSNFDPVQMWNAGCQLVALNYQTSTLPMQLNQGLFQDNGGCGYVLKPAILTEDNSTFDPRGPFDDNLCTFLMIRVLGGSQVPYRSEGSIKQDRGLWVQVRVTGVEADNQKEKTKTVKSTGLSVTWNEVVAFKVHVPQLALVSFLVKDSADNLLAQYTLPMRCMTEGYRVVPLQSKSSEALAFASLLVHVELKGS